MNNITIIAPQVIGQKLIRCWPNRIWNMYRQYVIGYVTRNLILTKRDVLRHVTGYVTCYVIGYVTWNLILTKRDVMRYVSRYLVLTKRDVLRHVTGYVTSYVTFS